MSDKPITWEWVDEVINWLIQQLGSELTQQVDDAAAVFGSMDDDERHRLKARNSELSQALASLKRRDRSQPVGVLPLAERRAITLGMFARLCADRGVGGWSERLVRVLTADDILYRSIVIEFEVASFFVAQGRSHVHFLSEQDSGRKAEMKVGDLVDVECKRLQGRTTRDRQAADFWRRLERSLWKLTELGSEYVFVVEVAGMPLDTDIDLITSAAEDSLRSIKRTSIALDEGRVRCEFRRSALSVDQDGLQFQGIPTDTLGEYHVGRVDARAHVEGRTMKAGVACTFAFKTDQEPDLVRLAKRALKSARKQLPKDRPSIAVVDAYEPLYDLPDSERESDRRLIYNALSDELVGHDRPTGVMLAAPQPGEDPITRTFAYVGNPSPSAPFPTTFELFPGWTPATAASLPQVDN